MDSNEETARQFASTVRVLIEPDEVDGGFVAECPDLPGCFSQGETLDEALFNIQDAIRECLIVKLEDMLRTEGDNIPGLHSSSARQFTFNLSAPSVKQSQAA